MLDVSPEATLSGIIICDDCQCGWVAIIVLVLMMSMIDLRRRVG